MAWRFSSHHSTSKPEQHSFFPAGMDPRQCNPDCSGGCACWAPLRPVMHISSRPVSPAGHVCVLLFDSAAFIRTDIHLSIQVTQTAPPCPTTLPGPNVLPVPR